MSDDLQVGWVYRIFSSHTEKSLGLVVIQPHRFKVYLVTKVRDDEYSEMMSACLAKLLAIYKS